MSATNLPLSILLVEDEEYKVNHVQSVIDKLNEEVKVVLAKTQIEAQQALMTQKFDLMILDMQLPIRSDDTRADSRGGENILDDLFVDDNYKMPSGILVLTEFEELQDKLRESYPDVGVIKFDGSSSDWTNALRRKITTTLKSKKAATKIVYCEGQNAQLLNLIGFTTVEFRSLEDCRQVYMAAKNEGDKFALRDRDFLTTTEQRALTDRYKNYLCLDYYCFENYLYHPDNICEVYPDIVKQIYVEDIISQKNLKLLTIVQDYKLARNGYPDLNDNRNLIERNPEQEIVDSLKSDDFETFYPFFDMAGKKDTDGKKSYNKVFLASYNLNKTKLVQTSWFKDRISLVLEAAL